jgi:hypothetical protein
VINPNPEQEVAGFERMRRGFYSFLLGDRQGMTIIGPATIIKDIKKNPNKIELFTQEIKKNGKRIIRKRL